MSWEMCSSDVSRSSLVLLKKKREILTLKLLRQGVIAAQTVCTLEDIPTATGMLEGLKYTLK